MSFIHYLESIAGIAIYPLISLLVFFLFFTALAIYAVRADKQLISELKNIPLDKNENQPS